MSDPTIGRTEQEQIERGYPFIVRRNPQPIPAAAIDAQPAACALINLEWLAHIVGAIEAINQPDAWQGTDEEIYQAQQQLEALAAAFSTICDMAEGATVQFRQTDCTLEMSTDNGQTWTMIFNAGCATPVIVWNQDTGELTVDGEVVVNSETIINNTIIVNDTEELQPTGLDKRCDVASYYADLMLPSLMAEMVTSAEQSSTNVDAISSLIGFAVAVTGFIFTPATGGASAAAALAWIFGGLAVAETGAELGALIINADPVAMEAEMTPQFWQDVKCKIYCVLPSTGIVDLQVQQDIADEVETLAPAYPATIPLLSESIRSFTPEAIGKFNIFGALYDGSNCDLCACGPWQHDILDEPWLTKYVELVGTTYYDIPSETMRDSAATLNNDRIEFIVDLSKTPAIITQFRGLAQSQKMGGQGDAGDKFLSVSAWDSNGGTWVEVWNKEVSPFGSNALPNNELILPSPTIKLKVEMDGWGVNATGNPTRVHGFGLWGVGVDVIGIEKQEMNNP